MLISKNSGSQATEHRLQVARERGIPVLELKRPVLPGVGREFASAGELLAGLVEDGWGRPCGMEDETTA